MSQVSKSINRNSANSKPEKEQYHWLAKKLRITAELSISHGLDELPEKIEFQ